MNQWIKVLYEYEVSVLDNQSFLVHFSVFSAKLNQTIRQNEKKVNNYDCGQVTKLT